MTHEQYPHLNVGRLAIGEGVSVWSQMLSTTSSLAGNVAYELDWSLLLETRPIASIDSREADPDTVVFNLLLDGDNTYFADDFLVHNKGSGSPHGLA